jgi:hypothetical protein
MCICTFLRQKITKLIVNNDSMIVIIAATEAYGVEEIRM